MKILWSVLTSFSELCCCFNSALTVSSNPQAIEGSIDKETQRLTLNRDSRALEPLRPSVLVAISPKSGRFEMSRKLLQSRQQKVVWESQQ
jgi:hypothetical protein